MFILLEDFTVNIVYKNKDLDEVGDRSFPVHLYCKNVKSDLMRVILDAENLIYEMENYKRKEEWSEEHKEAFQHIRHRILDAANSIERLPDNMRYKGKPLNSMPPSEYFAQFFKDNHN